MQAVPNTETKTSKNEGGSGTRQILVLSEENFVSQCLVEAIGSHIANCNVIHRTLRGALPEDGASLQLAVVCDKSEESLAASSELLHQKYPEAAICAVVETLERSTPALRRLVEKQIIKGVIPINLRFDVFMSAIDLLMKGGEHFPAALISNLKEEPVHSVPVLIEASSYTTPDGSTPLTTREVEILNLICEGVQNKNIAYELGLSENTVKVHVRNIYKKMRVRNRTEAAYLYFKKRRDSAAGLARPATQNRSAPSI